MEGGHNLYVLPQIDSYGGGSRRFIDNVLEFIKKIFSIIQWGYIALHRAQWSNDIHVVDLNEALIEALLREVVFGTR